MNPSTRRIIHNDVTGWGPTAFTIELRTPTATQGRLSIDTFLGSGWILEDGQLEPIGTLEAFLELQRERRIPTYLQ